MNPEYFKIRILSLASQTVEGSDNAGKVYFDPEGIGVITPDQKSYWEKWPGAELLGPASAKDYAENQRAIECAGEPDTARRLSADLQEVKGDLNDAIEARCAAERESTRLTEENDSLRAQNATLTEENEGLRQRILTLEAAIESGKIPPEALPDSGGAPDSSVSGHVVEEPETPQAEETDQGKVIDITEQQGGFPGVNLGDLAEKMSVSPPAEVPAPATTEEVKQSGEEAKPKQQEKPKAEHKPADKGKPTGK